MIKKILFFSSATITLALVILFFSIFTVNEYEFVIITQFGKPVTIIDNAGLYFQTSTKSKYGLKCSISFIFPEVLFQRLRT